MHLRNTVVVVTGASSGIGRATALQLADNGASVWAVARSEQALHALAAQHRAIMPLAADLTLDDDRRRLVDAVGPVDVLVNNAGIGWLGLVEDMPFAEVRRLFELNVLGLVDLTQRILPGMIERHRGHIVNVASVASWVALPPLTVYSATKFAVQGFSDGLRREMAGRGVAVTTINPGPVATRFGHRARSGDRGTEALGDELMPGVPVALVAQAVRRAVRMGGAPGYTTIAVPRLAGLFRLAAVPGMRPLVDAGARISKRARLAALGVDRLEPPSTGACSSRSGGTK